MILKELFVITTCCFVISYGNRCGVGSLSQICHVGTECFDGECLIAGSECIKDVNEYTCPNHDCKCNSRGCRCVKYPEGNEECYVNEHCAGEHELCHSHKCSKDAGDPCGNERKPCGKNHVCFVPNTDDLRDRLCVPRNDCRHLKDFERCGENLDANNKICLHQQCVGGEICNAEDGKHRFLCVHSRNEVCFRHKCMNVFQLKYFATILDLNLALLVEKNRQGKLLPKEELSKIMNRSLTLQSEEFGKMFGPDSIFKLK